MSINKTEFYATKKHVTKDLLDFCLHDATSEAFYATYEELYGPVEDSCETKEYAERADRILTYATHFLVELDPSYASYDEDDRICRRIDCFDRVSPTKYALGDDGNYYVTVDSDCNGTWTAYEYDSDGEISHEGKGETPQKALNAMRMVNV